MKITAGTQALIDQFNRVNGTSVALVRDTVDTAPYRGETYTVPVLRLCEEDSDQQLVYSVDEVHNKARLSLMRSYCSRRFAESPDIPELIERPKDLKVVIAHALRAWEL